MITDVNVEKLAKLIAERDTLQSQLTDLRARVERLHADGAVMRSLLEEIREDLNGIGRIKEALSTDAGRDLLARYREAVDLVRLVREERPEVGDQMSPDWAARADTLLANSER